MPLHSHPDVGVMKELVTACYEAGIRCFEFTNRIAEADQVFYELKKYCKSNLYDLKLGVGTIKNTTDAETFHSIGADFLISPIISTELIDFTKSRNILWIPGCSTASEVGQAENAGIDLVKIYPANLLGGPAFIKAMKDIFSTMQFLPTGGIKADKAEIATWLNSGAIAVGLGSQLFGKAPLDINQLSKTIRTLVE
ncbi:MAG: bifunctional 4-hydroxy-2-oxoglutarate aldolase/2-dehydro-3-deoxy-phosphogluconate aldolase [Cyclobacteriaceae bacterium]|nr:bifunctional 4-hydroxy-2-oxoglutarate aldolase/2-dehydro-3-deoxy-phosphogluconate aldolase [Cyclobacteriaceae bacterium]